MFTLRDFYHLPQLDELFREIVSGENGLVIVAGMEMRQPLVKPGEVPLIPGGRKAFFDILVQESLASNPSSKGVPVGKDKKTFRAPRHMRKQVIQRSSVTDEHSYAERILEATRLNPRLVMVDRLGAENITPALEAARRDLRIVAQMDTSLWGCEVVRNLTSLGAPVESLAGLSWIISVQRIATLCPKCKQPERPEPEMVERLSAMYAQIRSLLRQAASHLEPLPGFDYAKLGGPSQFFRAGTCQDCNYTGRSGELTAFDIYQATSSGMTLFSLPSRLSMEEYLLRLAAQGHIPLEDLLRLNAYQLHRANRMLEASQSSLHDSSSALRTKLTELEAANRVLVQRTQTLISLEDIAQALIASTSLEELAERICRRAVQLCGADRSILYYLRTLDKDASQAEVLAASGWGKGVLHLKVDLGKLFESRSEPTTYNIIPPGVQGALTKEADKVPIQLAGLKVPLIAQGKKVGLMIVHSDTKSAFLPGEIALLQTFANQASLAVQRAGLVEELRQKVSELEAAQVELVKKERMEHEMSLARQVQQSMLPVAFPSMPGFIIAARSEPARQVGGDFYDVIDLGGERFGLVIADVSDKGMPAALFMALTRSLILAEAQRTHSPRAVLVSVNRLLFKLGEPSNFVSVFYGVVDRASRRLTYTRAGHDKPVLLRGSAFTRLGGEGSVLGVLAEDELQLTEESLELRPGDRLILYTDGLTDALNPKGEFFGLERLDELLYSTAGLQPEEVCQATFSGLARYQAFTEQFDDMTMLVLGVHD